MLNDRRAPYVAGSNSTLDRTVVRLGPISFHRGIKVGDLVIINCGNLHDDCKSKAPCVPYKYVATLKSC